MTGHRPSSQADGYAPEPDSKLAVMFSRAGDEWETPQALFDQLNAEFNFVLDAAATNANSKCESFYSEAGIDSGRPYECPCLTGFL